MISQPPPMKAATVSIIFRFLSLLRNALKNDEELMASIHLLLL